MLGYFRIRDRLYPYFNGAFLPSLSGFSIHILAILSISQPRII
jgi:hypothetical protein